MRPHHLIEHHDKNMTGAGYLVLIMFQYGAQFYSGIPPFQNKTQGCIWGMDFLLNGLDYLYVGLGWRSSHVLCGFRVLAATEGLDS